MGQTRAVFGRESAHGHDADQGREIDVADGQGRQAVHAQAMGQIADGAGDGDGQADGRGRAHGHVDGDVAPGQKGHGHGAAADADQVGHEADNAAGREHTAGLGHLARGLGLDVEQHLDGNVIEEHDEHALEERGGKLGRDPGPEKRADQDAGGDALEDVPAHGAAPVVGPVAGDGGEDDGGEGRAESHLHDVGMGQALGGEKPVERRNHDNAASDAEQPGDDAGHDAEGQIGQPERQRRHKQLLKRTSGSRAVAESGRKEKIFNQISCLSELSSRAPKRSRRSARVGCGRGWSMAARSSPATGRRALQDSGGEARP